MVKQKAIIVDLDGTVADISHRLFMIQEKPKMWTEFYNAMVDDVPNKWCCELIWKFYLDYKILFVTGRPEEYRQQTIDWLGKNVVIDQEFFELHMRPSKDYRPDNVLKLEIYEKNLKDKYDILFVLEDRDRVVNAWRDLGLVCLQCAPNEEKNG